MPLACASAEGRSPFRPLSIGGFGVKWLPEETTRPIVLTYAIADREIVQTDAINCKHMGPPSNLLQRSNLDMKRFRDALDEAFHRWRDVADVSFIEVDAADKPDILVGEQTLAIGFAFTNLALGAPVSGKLRPILGASICLNPLKQWKTGFDGNLEVYDLTHTLTHEIGHAIGLDHPSTRGQIMSFRYSEKNAGLTDGDVRGAVHLYGPSRMTSASMRTPPDPMAAHGERAVSTVVGRSLLPPPN